MSHKPIHHGGSDLAQGHLFLLQPLQEAVDPPTVIADGAFRESFGVQEGGPGSALERIGSLGWRFVFEPSQDSPPGTCHLAETLRRPLEGSGPASPPLTLRPALSATGDLVAHNLIASFSDQQASDQKQLACVA